MNIDHDQFWNLLLQSQLVPQQALETVVAKINSQLKTGKGTEADANQIANCLLDHEVITKYQAEILLAGRAGPFRFGDYLILDRLDSGPLSGAFSARHIGSDHPVVLEFVAGDDEIALKRWKELRQRANRSSQINSANFVPVYEAIVLPEYRILVSPRINGQPLSEKLPRKARLPWKDSCRIAAQIAHGLSQLHAAKLPHGDISPRCIWLTKKGAAQLRSVFSVDEEFRVKADPKSECNLDYRAPEQTSKTQPTFASDIYSLGCTLHRMIRGLAPFAEYEPKLRSKAHQAKQPASLKKYNLPEALESLLTAMLNKSPEKRPGADVVAKKLAQLSEQSDKVFSGTTSPGTRESNYLAAIEPSSPFVGPQSAPATSIPTIESAAPSTMRPPIDPSFTPSETANRTLTRKKKSKTPALIVTGAIALMAGLVAFGAWWAMNIEFKKPQVVVNNENDDEEAKIPNTDDDNNASDRSVEGQGSRLVQVFVEDDGKELWETPTSGLPTRFSYLPTGVQIAMAVRPAELLANPEGVRTLRGLGPQFEATKDWLTASCGLELTEIDQLLVGFCSNNQLAYSTCFVVRPVNAIPRSQLVQLWRPQVTDRDAESGVYDNGQGLGYFVIPDPNDPEIAIGFAMGPVDQMKVVAELAGANPLPSNLNRLAIRSDDQRHFNLLFIKNSLFNDEGQSLLSGPLTQVRQHLRVRLPESLQSCLISLHLDDGLYMETYVNHRPETKPRDMADEIDRFLQITRDSIAANLANSPSSPYWNSIRSRFAIMVTEVYRNLRVGVEGDDVLANCWLPEIAAHNLVTGSELALTFSGGSSSPPVVQKSVPADLAELMKTKRDLNVTTNPDLGLLLAGIKTSILDDYGELPFEFDIKLLGNDLLKDGITQNQRPGNFDLSQKPLAEILTEIMYRANPDKDATGPNDPACKLVWVIGEEPAGSGSPVVLITTRDAAAAKNYELPPAFVTQQ